MELGLAIVREIGDRRDEGMILNELGAVALTRHDYQEAFAYFEEALGLRRELAYQPYVIEDLAGLAHAAWALGERERAWEALEEVLIYLDHDATVAGAERPFRRPFDRLPDPERARRRAGQRRTCPRPCAAASSRGDICRMSRRGALICAR
ncbi:MAG: tetratricopeptide repeat protein, partial [Caldilineaceae bacterium]|nr:tetratricopeptide repeat protein [Caldilineaceae bacterium]